MNSVLNKYFEFTYFLACLQLECWKVFWYRCRLSEVWNILRFCFFNNEMSLKYLPFRHPYICRMDCCTFLESFLMEVFGFLELFEEVGNYVLLFWRFRCQQLSCDLFSCLNVTGLSRTLLILASVELRFLLF